MSQAALGDEAGAPPSHDPRSSSGIDPADAAGIGAGIGAFLRAGRRSVGPVTVARLVADVLTDGG